MEEIVTARPNKKAGNLSPDFKKKRKNFNKKSGKDNKSEKKGFTIPKFLQPEFTTTAAGKLAVAEAGGVKDNTSCGLLTGSSFIVTSKDGSKKKPIYIFKKKSFIDGLVSHKKSMLFDAKHQDYVIAEAHRNYIDENDCGTASLMIFQICKDWSSDKNPKPFKFVPVLKYYHKFTYEEVSKMKMIDFPISSSDNEFMNMILSELKRKKLEFLEPAVCAAVDKSNERETSYSWYHSSKLADAESIKNIDSKSTKTE